MRRDDGGPAFPRAGYYPPGATEARGDHLRELLATTTEPQEGLSLRDYFASKVLQSLVSYCPEGSIDRFTALCYRWADAMLDARRSKPVPVAAGEIDDADF